MKTQVAIIGGGPSGLLLSQLLNKSGIDTIVIERASREHVLSRIRAGVLETGTVSMLDEAGVADRARKEGFIHRGCYLTDDDLLVHINFHELTGKNVLVYGQTEVTRDLYEAQSDMGTTILHNVENVQIYDADSSSPYIVFRHKRSQKRIDCAYIAGCDGFHGVSRSTIPENKRKEYERTYPFGWLGVLSQTTPAHEELIYANSSHGFALASMRSKKLSRYYVQVPVKDEVKQWSDDRFWERLKKCLPDEIANNMETGPSIEKSIAPLRSYVNEPMRWGRLFLVGDAAHIVPPTGAKGLNLAVSDVHYLYGALIDAIKGVSEKGIDEYSTLALARIWNAMRFSWTMTTLLHKFDGEDSFATQMRRANLAHLARSETARKELAENYIGLPF